MSSSWSATAATIFGISFLIESPQRVSPFFRNLHLVLLGPFYVYRSGTCECASNIWTWTSKVFPCDSLEHIESTRQMMALDISDSQHRTQPFQQDMSSLGPWELPNYMIHTFIGQIIPKLWLSITAWGFHCGLSKNNPSGIRLLEFSYSILSHQ